jgi:Holliday junction resolvase RusA-like endonuclease
MILTECWIPGLPKTKGSLNFIGERYVKENVKGSTRWRVLVADAVRRDRKRRALSEPAYGPVAVRALFWLPAPRNPNRDFGAPVHAGAGDVDKLARNVLDALADDAKVASKNGGAFVNDNQVCDLLAVKFLATPSAPPGLALTVWTLEDVGFGSWMITERARIERATLQPPPEGVHHP